MSTVAVYNGFGQYETAREGQYEGAKEGQKGIAVLHGGVPFWFPFEQVTYIPDFTMRHLDENESLFETGDEGILVYKTARLSGERIAEELLDTQVPIPNKDKGLLRLSENTPKLNKYKKAFAGISENGAKLYVEVQEVQPSDFDIKEAERRALAFKQETIKKYFQSKRERMAGGAGYFTPSGLIGVFMDELGVKDIDDVFAQKNPNEALDRLVQALQGFAAAKQEAPPVDAPPAPVRPPESRPPAASLV